MQKGKHRRVVAKLVRTSLLVLTEANKVIPRKIETSEYKQINTCKYSEF